MEPTAARDSWPAYFPTTIMSAALNKSCKIPDSINGTANTTSFEKRGPLHISISYFFLAFSCNSIFKSLCNKLFFLILICLFTLFTLENHAQKNINSKITFRPHLKSVTPANQTNLVDIVHGHKVKGKMKKQKRPYIGSNQGRRKPHYHPACKTSA